MEEYELLFVSGRKIRLRGTVLEHLWESEEVRIRDEHGRWWYFPRHNIEMYRTI